VSESVAIRDGLVAWAQGDLDALERVLDPLVTLKALQPGPLDCNNREEVMALLRQREARRMPDQSRDVDVVRQDDTTFLVRGLGGGDGVATVVTIAGGMVIALQQISTDTTDPDSKAAVGAVRTGDVAALTRILDAHPGLAQRRVPGYQGRTLLHIATDWPGYHPGGPEIIRILIEHGANPNDRGGADDRGETPLHWAASSDDVDVARALLDGGADLETPNGSIGTPLDNAIGYRCWHVAQLLADRGARIDKLWHAAALGRLDLLETVLATEPDVDQISQAFWHACAASQRRAADRLLTAGADLGWTPEYAEGTALDVASEQSTRQQNIVQWLRGIGATTAHSQD
jgi:uncharacterized protein